MPFFLHQVSYTPEALTRGCLPIPRIGLTPSGAPSRNSVEEC